MKIRLKSILKATGILSVFFYLAHVVLGGCMWHEYSHIHQPISDLTATGAPNRSMLLVLTTIYGVLGLIFAISFTIFKGRESRNLVFWGGISFILLHIVSLSYNFFPQDLPGSEPSFAGMMHLVVTILIVPFTILSPLLIGIGLKKEKAWKKTGNFSVMCAILILIFGGLTGYFYAQGLPFFGLVERLNIGTLQIWTFVLSYKLTFPVISTNR